MTDVRGIPLQPAEHEVNPVSFRFLVSILSRRRPLPPRFQSQTRLCAMTYVKYDVLLRYEDMTTAIRIVNARLGIHGAHVVTEGDGIQSMHDVNPHVAARVNRLYADDVRNFGYA